MNCIVESWTNYEAELRGFLARKMKDARLAEDLLQDIFVKAIAQGSSFCSLDNPRAWLFKVARNQLIDHYRSKHEFIDVDDELPEAIDKIDAIETLSACLPRALHQLSDSESEIIRLCDLEGMNQADYAKQNNISLSGAKSRIQRARKHLKQQLHNDCQVQFDDSGRVCCYVPCSK